MTCAELIRRLAEQEGHKFSLLCLFGFHDWGDWRLTDSPCFGRTQWRICRRCFNHELWWEDIYEKI